MKSASPFILALAISLIAGCRPNAECQIEPGELYAGDGILVSESFSGEDGQHFVVFFPVCQLDTAAVLASLQRAGKGVMFFTSDFWQIRQALREKAVVVNDTLRTSRPYSVQKLRLLPVRIAFKDTLASETRLQRYPFRIRARELQFHQRVYSASQLDLSQLTPL